MNTNTMKVLIAFFISVIMLAYQVRLAVNEKNQLEFEKFKFGCGVGQ